MKTVIIVLYVLTAWSLVASLSLSVAVVRNLGPNDPFYRVVANVLGFVGGGIWTFFLSPALDCIAWFATRRTNLSHSWKQAARFLFFLGLLVAALAVPLFWRSIACYQDIC